MVAAVVVFFLVVVVVVVVFKYHVYFPCMCHTYFTYILPTCFGSRKKTAPGRRVILRVIGTSRVEC